MKRFLFKSSLFLFLVFTSFLYISSLADGNTDPFYLRFTSPKQTSLILGTSRAAQGIQPAVLDATLDEIYPELKTYNFSFTVVHSPYGPVYYQAINKKLDKDTKNGLFILAVDPWAISTKSEQPDDTTRFLENELSLATTHFYNLNPNLEYLLENHNTPLASLIFNKIAEPENQMILKDNGWLEVSIPMKSSVVEERTLEKVEEYKKNMLPYYKFSAVRLQYLAKTINLLRNHGDVYLVRLPVDDRMYALEQKLMPEFDTLLNKLAVENNIAYINFINSRKNYRYTDGNHIEKDSGKRLTADIASAIRKGKEYSFHKK